MSRLMTMMTTSSSISVNARPFGAESVFVTANPGNSPASPSVPDARLRYSPQAAVECADRGPEHRGGDGRCQHAPAPNKPPHTPSFARVVIEKPLECNDGRSKWADRHHRGDEPA